MSKVYTRDTTQIRVPDFPTGPIEILLLSVSLFLLCTVPTNNASQPPVPPTPSSGRSSTESSPVSISYLLEISQQAVSTLPPPHQLSVSKQRNIL
jgi:hypothetical protein